jgi:hypothetical protein
MTDSEIRELIAKIKETVFTDQDNLYYVLADALDVAEQRGYDEGYTYAANNT